MANYLIVLVVSAGFAGAWGCGQSAASVKETIAPVEREVTFQGPGITLSGTLLLPAPKNGKPVPAMLLLPGSGPSDRDGNQLPTIRTDVLKQVAERLASEGVASLRFDKRAIARYRDVWPKTLEEINHFFKWENFVGDATAGYRFLKEQKDVDPNRVGIFGHSEGALLALQIGSNLAPTKQGPFALVLVGGTGRPMGIVLHEQIARQLSRSKASPEVTKKYLDYLDTACSDLAQGKTYAKDVPQGLGVLFNPTVIDIMQAYCRLDPPKLAKAYDGPVLIVNGAHDTQVSAERDAPRLEEALKSRPHGTVAMLIVPNASHCLKATSAGVDDVFDGPIVSSALDAIAEFVKKSLNRRSS